MLSDSVKDTALGIAVTLLGSLLPIMIGILVLLATETDFTLEWLAGNGQFAVFSAALVLTATYFIAKPTGRNRLPGTARLLIPSYVVLALAVALYVIATLAVSGEEIETGFIAWPTIVLFGCAMIITSIAVYLDTERTTATPQDVMDNRSQDIDALGKEIEEARKRRGEKR